MMKYILIALCFFISFGVKAQSLPTGAPSQKWNGWIEPIYIVPDSGTVIPKRDTNWLPSKIGMAVLWQHAGVDTLVWIWKGANWSSLASSSAVSNTNIANASLTAIANYTQNWTEHQLLFNNVRGVTFADTISGAFSSRKERALFNLFPDQFFGSGITLMTAMRNAANSADSLTTGLRSVSGNQIALISTSNGQGAQIAAQTNATFPNQPNASILAFSGSKTSQVAADGSKVSIDGADSIQMRGLIPAANADSILAFGPPTFAGGQSTYRKLLIIPKSAIGGGTVTSVGLTMPSAFSVTGSPVTTSGTLAVTGAGTSLQYIKGNGTLGTFDTGAIPNFYLKVRGLLSGTSPITYSQFTGAIGILDADASGQKGAATFANSDFSASSGLISLLNVVTPGSCNNCNLTIDAKGRTTAYSNGFGATNNIGGGFRWVATPLGDIKTAFGNNTITIDSSSHINALTIKVDTSTIATKTDLTYKANNDTIWKRQGVIIPPNRPGDLNNVQEPTVIREANPVIISTDTVFKMWYTQGWGTVGICYAESVDGRNWVFYSGNPIIANYSRSCVIHDGSTYALYAVPGVTGPRIDRFTSSNGVTFTLANSGVVVQGSPGTWNDDGVFNSWVVKDGSNWYMLADGRNLATNAYRDGLYTSSDGITWTPFANNPVTYLTGPYFKKIGNKWWLWGHISPLFTYLLPSDFARAWSWDMMTWNYDPIPYNSTFHRLTEDEGVDSVNGQVGDINLVSRGDTTYMFYSATRNGNAMGDSLPGLQIKLAIATLRLDSIVHTRENAPIFNSLETAGRNLYMTMGNVGVGGEELPQFSLDSRSTIHARNSFVSYSTASGASTVGYNLYFNPRTGANFSLIDTTKNGMALRLSAIDIQWIRTSVINTSTPTAVQIGGVRNVDSVFYFLGRALFGTSTDNGLGSQLQVTGPSWFNGNITALGAINLLRVYKGANSATNNAFVGQGLTLESAGDRNTGLGITTLAALTTASSNTAVGAGAGAALTTASFNTLVGDASGNVLLTGPNNNGFGRQTLVALQDGFSNNAFGVSAGRALIHGNDNLALGDSAMFTDGTTASTDVSGSIAIGHRAQVTQNNSAVIGGLNANGFAVRVGIDMTAPNAWLHLPAGLATAGFAALKFTSGPPTTTPEAGGMGFSNGLFIIDSSASKRDTIATRSWVQGGIPDFYTSNGTLTSLRTVDGNNTALRLINLDTLRANFTNIVFSRRTGGVNYSGQIIPVSLVWQFGYTPTPGLYTKGAGYYIDSNNNFGVGATPPTSIPLYAAGASLYAGAGFQNQGGNYLRVVSVSADATMDGTYYWLDVDASGASRTVTLPAASSVFGNNLGIRYVVRKTDATANTVTIQRNGTPGTDTINGASSTVITAQYQSKNIQAVSSTAFAAN